MAIVQITPCRSYYPKDAMPITADEPCFVNTDLLCWFQRLNGGWLFSFTSGHTVVVGQFDYKKIINHITPNQATQTPADMDQANYINEAVKHIDEAIKWLEMGGIGSHITGELKDLKECLGQ